MEGGSSALAVVDAGTAGPVVWWVNLGGPDPRPLPVILLDAPAG